MHYGLVSIHWTAQALTDAQQLVLRNIATLALRRDDKRRTFDFTHELVEGRLTRESDGLFVTFAGTFFHADLGTVRGERWTVDFLLPKGSERLVLDDQLVMAYRPVKEGLEARPIDQTMTKVGEMSLLN